MAPVGPRWIHGGPSRSPIGPKWPQSVPDGTTAAPVGSRSVYGGPQLVLDRTTVAPVGPLSVQGGPSRSPIGPRWTRLSAAYRAPVVGRLPAGLFTARPGRERPTRCREYATRRRRGLLAEVCGATTIDPLAVRHFAD